MNTQKTNFYINKTKVYRLGLPILAILFLYPSIVKQYQTVVFTKQLHINTSKQEPPRIAFKLVSADLKKEGFSESPALAMKVVDRIGAGDAVLALTSLCAVRKVPSEVISLIGNLAGAQAVMIVGNRSAIDRVQLIKSAESLLKK